MPSSKKSLVQPARMRSAAGFVLGFWLSDFLACDVSVLRASADADGAPHGAGEFLERERLSDHGKPVTPGFTSRQLQDLQLRAAAPGQLGQFMTVHAGHV